MYNPLIWSIDNNTLYLVKNYNVTEIKLNKQVTEKRELSIRKAIIEMTENENWDFLHNNCLLKI